MPGLLTLRPGLGSASKNATSKNAVSSARAEKGRDERFQSGKVPAAPALSRRGIFRAPSLNRVAPHVPSAAQPTRPKQVTDPLGEVVKAKLRGNGVEIAQRVGSDYSSSGSEHEINSLCLAEMVHEFMEDEGEVGKCGRARCNCESGTCGNSAPSIDSDDSKSSLGGELAEILQVLIQIVSLSERTILAAVSSTLKASTERSEVTINEKAGRSLHMRCVMSSLRSSGYNAAICKSRWDHAGGFPGGEYEYIDVIFGGLGVASERVIVDIDFRTQFEIARPTPQYAGLLQVLPSIFVGKADRLQQIVNILCDAAKQSLKKKGMPLPPWRKSEYIRAKWFASYRRTTKEASASSTRELRGADIGRIALRGAGWDSKFTTEMETSYHKAADLRKALRDSRQEGTEPEGVGRGAFRMLAEMQLTEKMNSSVTSMPESDEFGVASTVWEPPMVNVKVPSGKAPKRAAGLASILMEAGMIAQVGKNMQDLPEHRASTEGALSRELAMERA